MAKTPVKKPPVRGRQESKVVALRPGNDQVPDYVRRQTKQGRGVSSAAEDNLVPMIAVLQPLSPQLNKHNEGKYIEDAEPGSILVRGMDPEVTDELIFQHCHFSKSIVEWIPRSKGGGFVGRHLTWPKDMVTGKSDDGRRTIMQTSSGNHLIETRYHVGHVIAPDGTMLPYIIPFSSTGHTVSRSWMNMMNAVRLEGGIIPDAWTRLYRLTTVQRQNAAGVWYVLNPQPAGWATPDQALKGEELYESFERGEKTYGEEEETGIDPGPSEHEDEKPTKGKGKKF
jgi:hypothetical protein